ncbi:unnamed protein product, partial [Musa hybrid cultivar]
LCIDNPNQRFVTNFNPNDLAFPRCNGSIQLSIEHRVLLVFANFAPAKKSQRGFPSLCTENWQGRRLCGNHLCC